MRHLSSEEIDEVLVRNGVGILSMVDGDQPYGIPMSFGYDGESLTFAMQFGIGYDGRKTQCIDSNNNVSLTIYERSDSPDDDGVPTWRSVLITGQLTEVEQDQRDKAFATLAANAEFAPDLTVWGVPFEEVEFTLFSLDPTDWSGRKFSMHNQW